MSLRIRHAGLGLAALMAGLGLGSCTRQAPPGPAAGAAAEADTAAPNLPIDVMPSVIDAKVAYPEEARARGEEGLVQVKAFVGSDGKVIRAEADPAQAVSPALREAAVAAVLGWTFEPARQAGRPVKVWIMVPVNFRLR